MLMLLLAIYLMWSFPGFFIYILFVIESNDFDFETVNKWKILLIAFLLGGATLAMTFCILYIDKPLKKYIIGFVGF
jgi:hypothetical protein